MRIASVGHAVFAATIVGLGLMGLMKGDFATVWQPVPKSMPARDLVVALCACIFLASGAGLLWSRTAAFAARLLLAGLLLWLLLLRLPWIYVSPTLDMAWAACETAAMAAAAWVLYVWFATDRDRQRLGSLSGDAGLRIASVLYGLAIIGFGVAHFERVEATNALVPRWLPRPQAWTYLAGSAFIAAGVALLTNVWARLAAVSMAIQIGLFLLLVWVPVVARGSARPFQWMETATSLALTAGAWVMADAYRHRPWLAVDPSFR
jgi:uncharacterized membrane protein